MPYSKVYDTGEGAVAELPGRSCRYRSTVADDRRSITTQFDLGECRRARITSHNSTSSVSSGYSSDCKTSRTMRAMCHAVR